MHGQTGAKVSPVVIPLVKEVATTKFLSLMYAYIHTTMHVHIFFFFFLIKMSSYIFNASFKYMVSFYQGYLYAKYLFERTKFHNGFISPSLWHFLRGPTNHLLEWNDSHPSFLSAKHSSCDFQQFEHRTRTYKGKQHFADETFCSLPRNLYMMVWESYAKRGRYQQTALR